LGVIGVAVEKDSGRRGKLGVLCTLDSMPDGTMRVVLDDVANSSSGGRGPWTHAVLVTFKGYEKEALENLELSDQELAAFGHYVLARLVAVSKS
jgi:hypothetical protein